VANSDWWENILISGTSVRIHIDTGAVKSLLPYKLFKSLNFDKYQLKKTSSKLQSYTGHDIPVRGRAILATSYKNTTVNVIYYVVDDDCQPLLSGNAGKALKLIERIHTIVSESDFDQVKNTTGTLPGTYTLKIDPTVPAVVHGPRRQPRPLLNKITAKLKEMEDDGHIIKVTEPTDWVSSMVTVVKNDKVRICSDPRDLNQAIRREHYPIPTVEEVVSSVPDCKIFSKIDAKAGFLQIKLDYESSLLTTFNTPIGRYRWLRLPFGIKSAPEIFQRIMDTMLEGIDGARAVMDDILIAGRTMHEHDAILKQVLQRATEWNLKLNYDKCQIRKKKLDYVGHVVTEHGLQPDPNKVRAVSDMPVPKSKEEIRRFLGLVQYLSKFIPELSAVDSPLRDVIKNQDFYWYKAQQQSFDNLKRLCCTTPVLTYYNSDKEVTIQCDASSYALGAVLLQEGHPISYTSRALTATECNYAQIEKEMLAIVHACKRFHYYIFGKPVTVESDHKPLQAIFGKPLLAAPMRLQSMMLRLQPYDLHVGYKPGKDIPIGDALSRANLPESEPDIEPIMVNMIHHIAVTPTKYQQIQRCTADELNELHSIIRIGWPDTKQETPHSIREYWTIRDELAVADGVVYKGMRIVIPPSMRPDMLSRIHASHLGMTKCKQRAREAMFWPGMSQAIELLVSDCPACNTYQNKQHSESIRITKTPDLPWIEVASDLFEFRGQHYIATVDYYSKYIEVDSLSDLTSQQTIEALKSQFSRHGIPEKLRTDNGPQYASREFNNFCEQYQIEHATSSPMYAQSNGEAERAVQTIKRLWTKCTDKHLAMLDYRTTPLESCNMSPAQLLMSRRPRNLLPVSRELLKPQLYNVVKTKELLDYDKGKQKYYYNLKTGEDLPALQPGDPVRMSPLPGSKRWLPATVINHHGSPRSYVVESCGRKYRRNRKYLRLSTHNAHINEPRELRYTRDTPVLPHTQPRAHSVPNVVPDQHANTTNPAQDIVERAPQLPNTPGSPPVPGTPKRLVPEPTTKETRTSSGRLVKKPKVLDL